MNIKLELLRGYVADIINSHIKVFEIDASEIADTTAIKMISEIQKIVKDENYDDFEAMDEIVRVFERYDVSAGNRHDF